MQKEVFRLFVSTYIRRTSFYNCEKWLEMTHYFLEKTFCIYIVCSLFQNRFDMGYWNKCSLGDFFDGNITIEHNPSHNFCKAFFYITVAVRTTISFTIFHDTTSFVLISKDVNN